MSRVQPITGVAIVMLSVLSGSPVGVLAQEATPVPGTSLTLPAGGDPALCVATPRPIAEYEALVGTPVPATPAVYQAIAGAPADQTTIDAITRTMIEVSACFNAGDFLRLGGLYTDAGRAEDTAGITAEGVAFFAATPVPAPVTERYVIFDITAVQTLPDGRVGAIVVFGPGGQGGADYMIFAKEGDRYLIDHWVDEPFELAPDRDAKAEATPAA